MESHNAADPQQVRNKAEKMDAAKKQYLNDIREVMKTKPGRRLLRTIIADSKLLYPSMTGNSWTYFNEGRRAIGIELFHAVSEACPGQIVDIVLDPDVLEKRRLELKEMSKEGGVDL